MTPKHRPPTHPGQILLADFLLPLNLTQIELAERLSIPIQRVNTIVRGKRGVSAETALLLAKEFGTTPEFWMNLQVTWDLYHAQQRLNAAA
jgi:addiction module HigA family antidote